MTPSLSVPTDNIYKFASLFGLALLIASILGFIAHYSTSLEAKSRYVQIISMHNSKEPKSQFDHDMITLNEKLLQVAQKNQRTMSFYVGGVGGLGLAASLWGFWRWRYRVQTRDDAIADLQLRKLRAEVASLEAQNGVLTTQVPALTPPSGSTIAP